MKRFFVAFLILFGFNNISHAQSWTTSSGNTASPYAAGTSGVMGNYGAMGTDAGSGTAAPPVGTGPAQFFQGQPPSSQGYYPQGQQQYPQGYYQPQGQQLYPQGYYQPQVQQQYPQVQQQYPQVQQQYPQVQQQYPQVQQQYPQVQQQYPQVQQQYPQGQQQFPQGQQQFPQGQQPPSLQGPAQLFQGQQLPPSQGNFQLQGQQPSSQQGPGQLFQGQQILPPLGNYQLLKGVQPAEMSDIEKRMSEVASGIAKPQTSNVGLVEQFGYNFFRPDAVGFAPLIDIPVGPDYVIGPGDTIVVSIWGSFEGTQELVVNRSGEILLPRVGAVKVWGVTYQDLPGLIKSQLSKVLKNFGLNVTMGKLRVIKVFVVGEVKAPGDYNVSSLSTLINALSAAGGPTKKGTLRSILVRRRGAPPETVDLYDFFLKGDKSRDIRLQPGDTIFVPSIGKVAAIAGNVRRPAIYELKDEKNLRDLFAMADGIISSSYLQRVQIFRVDAHEKQISADFNLDPQSSSKTIDELTAAVAIQDMDLVNVFPIDRTLRNSVRLLGYVLRPGDYALKPGMRVKDLIGKDINGKDNLLPEYNSDVAVITRLVPPNLNPERIYINPARALADDPKNNIELQEFDTLQLFSRWDMEEMPQVTISGEVQRPGTYRLYDNMRLRDIILEAGNVKKTAFQGNAEITRLKITKEKVSSYSINVSLQEAMRENPENNILIEPYDEVQIRRIPDWMEETNRYVLLKGEFKYPGVYAIFKGEKMSSVIERAGGFTPKAYLQGAKFTRQAVKELQQKRMDEIIARTEQNIAQKQADLASTAASKEELDATKAALQGLAQNMEKLKLARAEGRVSIKLAPLDKFKETPYDVELMGLDTLEVPQSVNAVNVLGEVYSPTTFIQIPGKDVSFYLKKAGGPTQNAEEDEMYVIKADGTVISKQQSSSYGIRWDDDGKKWSFGGFYSTQLEAGDTLVVPQKIDKTAWLREIKDITTIISQIALSAGTVFLGLK